MQHDRILTYPSNNDLKLTLIGSPVLAVLVGHDLGVTVDRRVNVSPTEDEDPAGGRDRLIIRFTGIAHIVDDGLSAELMDRIDGSDRQILLQ